MAKPRRRRSTARRRTTAARRTPNTTVTRRRRRTRRSNPTVFSSSRRRTTARRRSVSRRRNPSTGGLLSQAAGLAAGITVVGLAQGFIPPIGGVSPIMVAARQAATGYLIGEGMQRFGVMRAYSGEVKLAGFALGAGTLINAYVLPLFSGFFRRPAPVAVDANGNGVQGIGYYQPAAQPFQRYRNNGMGGIGVITPNQQPFGDYVSVV